MAREDGLAAGVRTRFSSEYQPANRGRKPSKLKSWIKENNVSNDDFIAIFKTIIATHTLDELEIMVNKKNKGKLPVIIALCISAFLHDMRTGTLTGTNSILDRIMGKPTQQINHGINTVPEESLYMLNTIFSEKPKTINKPKGKPSERKPRAKC